MTHIDLVVATRKRYSKLMRMLGTVPGDFIIKNHIVFDGDLTGYGKFIQEKVSYGVPYLVPTQSGSVYCRNHVTQHCDDGVLIACDDIEFELHAIELAFNHFQEEFPDDDGVVGFNQWNAKPEGNFCWTGVCLVGQKFLQRYPKKMLLYPAYNHFATREIEWLASKLGKLYKSEQSRIFHYHPDWFKKEMDTTHKEARVEKKADAALKLARRKMGLLWGETPSKFQRIGGIISDK
jgi:hypothetical protein